MSVTVAPLSQATDPRGKSPEQPAPAALKRITRVLQRALSMDSGALVRIQQLDGALDLFVSTPLGCVVSQRLVGAHITEGVAEGDTKDAPVVNAYAVEAALRDLSATHWDFGSRNDFMWRGSMPPAEGFELVDWVPAEVIRGLHADMGKENAENSGPGGIARSLLNQEMMAVQGGGVKVVLDGRLIAAIGGLGIAAQPTHPQMMKHDHLRVSANASWNRIDALFGTVYAPRPGGLVRVPGF